MKTVKYQYKNAPIPGGGYVTGFLFSKQNPNLFFCRTDIGGVYRYERKEERWKSLIDHVTMEHLDETFPTAIAVDDHRQGRLYIACGVDRREEGVLAVSDDNGTSFSYRKIPVAVHGNLNGRSTGYRLVTHPQKPDCLYFASQKNGLLISQNAGQTWTQTDICGERYLTFVWVSEQREGMLIVGTAGVTTGNLSNGKNELPMRGTTLYISYDDGKTFEPLPQPENIFFPQSKCSGYVAQRYDYDGTYLYITLAHTGATSYVVEMGYSCDSGDTLGGKVLRYSFTEDGSVAGYEDITPKESNAEEGAPLTYGFSGISTCRLKPGLVIASTICRENGDFIYRSFDYGTTWEAIYYDLDIGELDFHTSYMKPEYNGGKSIIHWLSDIKINPFQPEEAWFNSGTGVFCTKNLLSEKVRFLDWSDGIEETVHINVYSPNGGPAQVIDMVGDLGGFAFRDLTKPCRNSFDDKDGNRYITCINADYSELDPNCFVVTARGNWTGKTKGGLIMTKDGGETFTRLSTAYGITDQLDELFHRIEKPNYNSGWVAMSPDCQRLVWSVAEGIELPLSCVLYSDDAGQSFHKCSVYNLEGEKLKGTESSPVASVENSQQLCMKVFSDRVDNSLFYGFGEASQFYVSTDGGATFYQKQLPKEFPTEHIGLIDVANKTEIRGDAGRSGIFYMAMNRNGLWKLTYSKEKDSVKAERLTAEGDAVYRMGLGVMKPGAEYLGQDKAIYLCATIDGTYGFYRSFDEAKTFERINTAKQMFGEILSIDGDSRVFGRFYLATGSRGLLYGEEVEQ